MKKLFLFCLILFISLFMFSCNNNILKPSDYTKDEIDRKYPYWKVGIERFQIDNTENRYTVLTVDEKRFTLEGMALIRLIINTEEFALEVKAKQGQLISGENDSYNGKSLKEGDVYDTSRLIDVIRTVQKNFIYEKSSKNQSGGLGTLGNSRYLRYGLQEENKIFTGDWVCFQNQEGKTWISWNNYRVIDFARLMFHEHMHNIGFNHTSVNNGKDVPYQVHGIVDSIGNKILYGELKNKYARQLDELTAYYLTEYKNLLSEDTVFDPSKK